MSRTDTRNLTGAWNGLYSYNHPTTWEPVSFTAQLQHTGEWLAGMTAEAAPIGTLTSTLRGRIGGSQVTFLKLYDRQVGGYDAVHYSGEVDADGEEIWGSWTIRRVSGTFLMVRSSPAPVAVAEQRTAKA